MPQNAQVLIASVPNGPLAAGHFELRETAPPDCGEGQVLCRTLALTIGAGQRAGLQGSASYAGAPRAGVVMGGTGVARVEASNAAGFTAGDLVVGPTGWQVFSVHAAKALRKVPAAHARPAVVPDGPARAVRRRHPRPGAPWREQRGDVRAHAGTACGHPVLAAAGVRVAAWRSATRTRCSSSSPARIYRAVKQEVADDGEALPLDTCSSCARASTSRSSPGAPWSRRRSRPPRRSRPRRCPPR